MNYHETFLIFKYLPLFLMSCQPFWMDNQVKEKQSKGFISLDDNAIPLYDREYTLGLTSMDDLDNPER